MDFEQMFELVSPRIQIDKERAESIYKCSLTVPAEGEFWELGVFTGGSARLLAEVIREQPRTLRLFDTFNGFPSVSTEDITGEHIDRDALMDMFKNISVDEVKQFVAAEFAVFHVGIVPDTLRGLEESKIAFVHLDLDLYEPTKSALEFILPRLLPGGIIVVDDYGA